MSTVLWSNVLVDGKVKSWSEDKFALYKHSKKLDKLTKSLGVARFVDVQDFTDVKFNMSNEELPEGMQSTNELMAVNGVWISGERAVEMLEALISHIIKEKTGFGLLSNDHMEVLNELQESLEVAREAKEQNGKFNFSVVT